MVLIIAVVGRKGGIGKTTVSVHLAGELAARGCRAALIDADPQGSAAQWAAPGKLLLPVEHLPVTVDKLKPWVERVRRVDADVVILDCPPHLDAALGRRGRPSGLGHPALRTVGARHDGHGGGSGRSAASSPAPTRQAGSHDRAEPRRPAHGRGTRTRRRVGEARRASRACTGLSIGLRSGVQHWRHGRCVRTRIGGGYRGQGVGGRDREDSSMSAKKGSGMGARVAAAPANAVAAGFAAATGSSLPEPAEPEAPRKGRCRGAEYPLAEGYASHLAPDRFRRGNEHQHSANNGRRTDAGRAVMMRWSVDTMARWCRDASVRWSAFVSWAVMSAMHWRWLWRLKVTADCSSSLKMS